MSDREFSSTRTSVRKFFGKDQVQNPSDEESTGNATHIVESAVGLSSISEVVTRLASVAREQMRTVRSSLLDAPARVEPDEREDEQRTGEDDGKIFDLNTISGVTAAVDSTGDRSQRVVAAAQDLVMKSGQSVFGGSTRDDTSDGLNSITPSIDDVTVSMDTKKGSIDCFFTRVRFDLPTDAVTRGDVVAIRVFRSVSPRSSLGDQGRLSLHAVDRLRTNRNRSRQKNQDLIGPLEHRLRESGVDNALGALIPLDQFLNTRTAADVRSTGVDIVRTIGSNGVAADVKEADLEQFLLPASLMHLDRSVVRDLKSLRNIQVQNPSLAATVQRTSVSVGGRPFRSDGGNMVVDVNNKQGFVEIGFISPDKLASHTVGDVTEYFFEDQSVSYGRTYRYFLVSVDRNMNESVRSRIVEVAVDGLRVPERPRRVSVQVINSFVSMTIQVDDQLVEKFEIYRKTDDPGLAEVTEIAVRTVLPETGFASDLVTNERLPNALLHIGEVLNAFGKGGGTFRDLRVLPGRNYTYRIYSVDIFGNKSESPYEVDVFVPDPSSKIVDLRRPTIVAEVDSKTNKCRITFAADDSRVVGLFLARRDLTIRQKAFTPPGEVNHLKMGNGSAAGGGRTFEDVHLNDQNRDVAWNGYFENNGEQRVFVDDVVSLDHVYQYRIFGVDRFGNRTSAAISRPVFITRRPFINSPLDLKISVVTGSDQAVSGVQLSWADGNIDISSEDRVGNREDLENSFVRTLFQVERRRAGEERWLEFPMVETRTMFDPIESSGQNPDFRPAFVKLNESYVYRVQAYQTGNFISNFSFPIAVFVGAPTLPPVNFQVKPADTKVRPFYVMLNWDTDPNSGIIDKWEIERAEVNNIAAARINSRNPTEMAELIFTPFRTIYKESSRFRSAAQDAALTDRTNPTIVGEHHFMDNAVTFGNSYFYRIRSVGTNGDRSAFSYRGVKVTDQSFESKIGGFLSVGDRVRLSTTLAPARAQSAPLPIRTNTTFGLVSSFAKVSVSAKPVVSSTLAARTRKFR